MCSMALMYLVLKYLGLFSVRSSGGVDVKYQVHHGQRDGGVGRKPDA